MALVGGKCWHRENWRENAGKAKGMSWLFMLCSHFLERSVQLIHAMASTGERIMLQGSALEKENKIAIIVLPDKSTYLARCGVSATLSSLLVSLPSYQLACHLQLAPVGQQARRPNGLMSLTVKLLVTTSRFPISSLWGDTRKIDKGPKCPTAVRDEVFFPFPKTFSLFQPPARPPLFLPPPSLVRRTESWKEANVQILKQFLCEASSGFNFFF